MRRGGMGGQARVGGEVRSTHLLQLQQVEAEHLNGLYHLKTEMEMGRDRGGEEGGAEGRREREKDKRRRREGRREVGEEGRKERERG